MSGSPPTPGVAVVTGGGSGIGAAVTARLRKAGHRVFVADIAGSCDIECDVRDASAVDRMVQLVIDTAGVPERVVTCAGIGHSGTLLDTPPEDAGRVLDINLWGTWLVLRATAAAMVRHGVRGSMVAVSSISGTLADRGMGAYCVSKAAVEMLVRVAAVEWGRHGIRVNAVGPGVTQTPMLGNAARVPGWLDDVAERTALGRLGEPDDVAGAVVALLEMAWVTGQVVHADGGLALHSPIDSYGAALRLRRDGG